VVRRVREQAYVPLAVGFGISTPAQAAAIGTVADGVIVGSALIKAVERAADPAEEAGSFVRSLREALQTGVLTGLQAGR
jgi:tryptophan synthase alpha chain